MKLTDVRRQLTKKEMNELTEKALTTGPFVVESVERRGVKGKRVLVSFLDESRRVRIDVGA
jgi:hypothetical protein